MAQVASELISITNNQKLADSKYIQDEALGNKKQSDINKDSLAGGVYNVTKLRPLQSGYYTITTAIAAVPQALRSVGMVITYQTASDSWETKQFKGALSDWTDSSKWEDFGGGGNNNGSGDGVYDISAANLTDGKPTSYASLQEALNAFTDTTQQKGGMSIMFIDSSTGRYVQYRHTRRSGGFYNTNNWVRSIEDKVYVNIDLPEESEWISGCLSGNSASYNTSGGTANKGKHVIVEVKADTTYILAGSGGWYGWLNSSKGIMQVNNAYRTWASNAYLVAPVNAKYLSLDMVDYQGNYANFTLLEVKEQGFDQIEQDIETLKDADLIPTEGSNKFVRSGGVYEAIQDIKSGLENVDLSQETETVSAEAPYSLSTTKWYLSGGYGRHIVVSVTPGEAYILANSGKLGYYGWLTSAHNEATVSASITIPYVSGTNRLSLSQDSEIELEVPANAAYLCLCTYDGGGNKSGFSLKKIVQDNIDSVPTADSRKAISSGGVYTALGNIESSTDAKLSTKLDKYEFVKTILLSEYEEYKYSIGGVNGANNGGWYYSSAVDGGYHKAIPVTGGRYYMLDKKAYMKGWVSSYVVPTQMGQYVNWVSSGYDRSSLNKDTMYQAPLDATYLIICTKGGDGAALSVPTTITEYKFALDGVGGNSSQFVKFRIAHWNLGHFSYYDGRQGANNPTMDSEKSAIMLPKYRSFISRLATDILCICEDDPNFDATGENKTLDVLYPIFEYKNQGTKNGFMCASIYVNGFKVIGSSSEINCTVPTDVARYWKVCICEIGGRTVKIVEAHLSSTKQYIKAQAEVVAALCENDDYAIICGDMNTTLGGVQSGDSEPRLSAFLDAGFTPINDGYFGTMITDREPGNNENLRWAIDHIFVKGFNVINVGVLDDALRKTVTETTGEGNQEITTTTVVNEGLSDHCPIYCDLTFKVKEQD